jgi:diguanylate cyclase (GGDEF)-like protein
MAEDRDKAKILLVDDAPENLQLLRQLLRENSDVEFAASGEEALAAAANGRPDLVLLDVNMPGMDGYEVCRRLKAEPSTQDIAVVFLTECDEESDEARALSLGAVDYITKPITSPVVYTRIVNQLAISRTNTELKRLATTDSLTGAFNRRHFLELAAKEMARMRRYRHSVSCLMLDIDHFKQVNDRFGHDVGDRAIIATVEMARKALRTEDVFGRLGGEEFAAMLPMTAIDKAEQVAERLRIAISVIRIPTPQGELAFTVSIGLVEVAPEGESFEQALKRADEALYQAKHLGRNRTVTVPLATVVPTLIAAAG